MRKRSNVERRFRRLDEEGQRSPFAAAKKVVAKRIFEEGLLEALSILCAWCGVRRLGFTGWGLGLRVWVLGFKVQGVTFRVQSSGCGFGGSGCG